jgi:predicted ABC-type sugar transport system permease subunit
MAELTSRGSARVAVLKPQVYAWVQDYGVYAAVLVLLLFNVLFTPHFLDASNFRTQLVQVTPVVIVSLGMALVIGTQGIDLSVGSVMALAAALTVLYLGYGWLPAVLVASACNPSWPRWRCWSASAAWPTCWCRSSSSSATPVSSRSAAAPSPASR